MRLLRAGPVTGVRHDPATDLWHYMCTRPGPECGKSQLGYVLKRDAISAAAAHEYAHAHANAQEAKK